MFDDSFEQVALELNGDLGGPGYAFADPQRVHSKLFDWQIQRRFETVLWTSTLRG